MKNIAKSQIEAFAMSRRFFSLKNEQQANDKEPLIYPAIVSREDERLLKFGTYNF